MGSRQGTGTERREIEPTISAFTTEEASAEVLLEIHTLVVGAFDDRFSGDDWQHTLGGTHFVVSTDRTIVAHAAVVSRSLDVGDRAYRTGYVEGVATALSHRRQGFGSLAMQEASHHIKERYELGALSTAMHGFYEHVGWERWRGPSFVRQGTSLRRTEDEDEGLMVLRFGPSATADLGASISCEARAGDDW